MLAEVGQALALIVRRDAEVWQITGVSFAVSLSAVLVAVVLGLPATYALATSGARGARIGMWIAHTVAVSAGLGFLPVQEERYDFVVPTSRMNRPGVAAFRKLLGEPATREALARLGLRP